MHEQIPLPPQTWYWVLPDPLLPEEHEFYPVRESAPAPCVMIFGELENPRNSHGVPFTKEWQLFAADLMALSEFGRLFGDLTEKEEIKHIKKAFTNTFSYAVAFTNKTGFPAKAHHPARANYITGEGLDAEDPRFDKVRRCGTDSITGMIVENTKGEKMVQVDSFAWEAGPPEGYGPEILEDSRVAWATNIYAGGAVGKFPRLNADVPYPFVTREPVYYPLNCLEKYEGEKRPLYFSPIV